MRVPFQRPIGQVISKSIENQDEEVVADVDKENFRRELARERTVSRPPPSAGLISSAKPSSEVLQAAQGTDRPDASGDTN